MAGKIDHDHPLYLSSSDVPGAVQIGIQLTGMENYTLWSRAMELTLLTKNKLGFVDGTIKHASYTVDFENKQWDRCNAIVLSWLMSNVSKELVSGILFRADASLVWNDLKERFDKVNMSRIFHLHKAIVTHTQGTSPVSVYYSKLKDLWDEFDSIVPPPSCNCAQSKEYIDSMFRQKLLQFLMGLNDNYSHARSQILMMSTPHTVNQCYAMIIQDESQRELSGDHYNIGGQVDSTALFTNRSGRNSFGNQNSRGPGVGGYDGSRGPGNVNFHRSQRGGHLYCDHCEMKGHSRADCNKLKYCTHCHKHGHLKEICYQLIGYPTNYKGKKLANNVSTDYGSHAHNDEIHHLGGSTAHQGSQHYGINSGIGSQHYGAVPYVAPNQYNQILQMLNKPLIHEGNATNAASTSGKVNVAVDSGATDHIVGTTSLLNHGLTDLFTGKVKEIGEEDDGLYILKSSQLLDTGQHKNLTALKEASAEGHHSSKFLSIYPPTKWCSGKKT
ncbi:hypothetical protein KY290_014659 [Solanum tuberosum]|uniref:Retrotransposon Copia-like N-terminal domain-containing protein n=1 Tax=Solanum tuberosum TaxID=4113 RepID=A0ABQ7VQH1_SOLTU|nr:hypothetical protein KY290_014659 [Solanum tuberosum]